jgi:hypothetical protein
METRRNFIQQASIAGMGLVLVGKTINPAKHSHRSIPHLQLNFAR